MAGREHDPGDIELNAEFAVEPDGGHLSLVLESGGGGTSRGPSRNHQYVPVLTLLLRRLRDQRALLVTALLASALRLPKTSSVLIRCCKR
ncbi:hypothetical protein DMH04_14525 [Kibdelosporangium aridum]|uniref:Uncharacterized protein n=1 Tax=Kibdelosporangium aridum TaxID=2030 RepID=A0A428ZEH0_KIBAR|nr:hypothetical protein DMH04_14525 [Kibdelosporangium aridum]